MLKFGRARRLERVHGDDLADQIVLHVAAHAADDRHDGDEERHADRDAEQGEEALELLHADLSQREADGFEEAA